MSTTRAAKKKLPRKQSHPLEEIETRGRPKLPPGKKKVMFSVFVTPDMMSDIKKLCQQTGARKTAITRVALSEYLERQLKKQKRKKS